MTNSASGPYFSRLTWDDVDWDVLDGFADRSLFQTRAWIGFLAEVQQAEPVVARLCEGDAGVGYFTGLIVRRMGMRFLGSPLPGWTTPYMGFNLDPGVSRTNAAKALQTFAFNDLRCAHFELRDRLLTENDVVGLGLGRRNDVGYDDRTFELDLARSEDEVFAGMTSACRRAIRKAEKSGVTIEEASDDAFASEFHEQLREVFVRQGLVPTYGVERVRALIRHLQPAGMLLLLRARDADGRSIATGIYPAFNDMMFFWGGASLKEQQHLRPNEALHWHALRYWKERGITRYDLGGYMDYKEKYGGIEVSIPGFRQSRTPVVAAARTLAPMGMRTKQTIIGGASQAFQSAARRFSPSSPLSNEASG